MRKTIFVFTTFIWLLNCCKAQQCEINISDNFFNEDLQQEKNVFTCVFERGISSIPHLIDLIDVEEKCRVGFHEITSSSFDEFSQNNFKGIKTAYLIESLIHAPEKNNNDGLPKTKLFGYGVIVRIKEGEPELQPLTQTDMKAVKEIYKSWWSKNQSKSLIDIRKENYNILKGSGYIWI